MKVRQLVPEEREVGIATLLDALSPERGQSLRPFAPEVLDLCTAFSQALFQDAEARRYPELVALAFWLRPAELVRLQAEFAGLETADTVLVPHGLALHFPPANVDTIFVYSWVFALLAGNRNVVRVSSRETRGARIIRRLLNALASDAAGRLLPGNTAMVTYDHDTAISAALSGACDLRVIWGGDASVNTIRQLPLPPHARELTFPNRYSLALLDAGAVCALSPDRRAELAERLYNDAYWFDQLGCSSPRLLIWLGAPTHCDEASDGLAVALAEVIARKGYVAETATALQTLTFAYGAVATRPVRRLSRSSNELTRLDLEHLQRFDLEHSGGGLFFEATIAHVDELVPLIDRRYQTLSYFGLELAELRDWVRRINGKGVDRVVPIGQALALHRYWDGYDLLQAMSRRIHLVR